MTARKRYYVGLTSGRREVFTSATPPTYDTHGALYGAVIGPFRTKRGAQFMSNHGANNPHCKSVADAERIATLLENQGRMAREYATKALTIKRG